MWVSLCSGCVDPVIIFLFLYSFFLISEQWQAHPMGAPSLLVSPHPG